MSSEQRGDVYGKHSVRAVFLRRPGDVSRVILGGKPEYHRDTIDGGAAGRGRARVRGLARISAASPA